MTVKRMVTVAIGIILASTMLWGCGSSSQEKSKDAASSGKDGKK